MEELQVAGRPGVQAGGREGGREARGRGKERERVCVGWPGVHSPPAIACTGLAEPGLRTISYV